MSATIACEQITKNLARTTGSFTNSTPAAWKATCKYYSGDHNCRPNPDVYKYTTKYTGITTFMDAHDANNGDDHQYGLPSIDPDTDVTKDNYQDYLQLCVTVAEPITCENLDYTEITSEVPAGLEPADLSSRCTEVGYYYDLMCKLSGDKCVAADSDCESLDMMLGHETISTEYCRGLKGCMVDQTQLKCEEFTAANNTNFNFGALGNSGMSLTQIQEKCEKIGIEHSEGYNMDFYKYNYGQKNFAVAAHAGEPVCVNTLAYKDIAITTDFTTEHCYVVGAMLGKITKVDADKCVDNLVPVCALVKFNLPLIYNHVKANKDKNNINSFYDNDETSDFGDYLCRKIECLGDSRDANGVYKCKARVCDSDQVCDYGHCADGECVCDVGYTGDTCETGRCTAVGGECGAHGDCTTDLQCECEKGYAGDTCEFVAHCTAGGGECGDHGDCTTDLQCECQKGYTGDTCETDSSNGTSKTVIQFGIALIAIMLF